MDDTTRIEIEAAVFRRLVHHFRERTDVQNIDLMTLSGFCRNCLSKWYAAAARERGVDIAYDESRALVYGMAYGEWKAKHQTEASEAKQQGYKGAIATHGEAGEKWFDKAI